MLRNYLTIALRNLLKHKGFTFINIFGLAIGFACCLLILLFIRDELSYDHFHSKYDRTYRLVTASEQHGVRAVTSPPVASTVCQEYPEILQATRLFRHWKTPLITSGDNGFLENRFLFADNTFFDVFSFPLLLGNPETALVEPFSVVLTVSMARKYFGDDNPVGQTLRFNEAHTFVVTGVLHDIPHNTHVHPDFVASASSLPRIMWKSFLEMWSFNIFYTYIVLDSKADPVALEAKLSDLYYRHIEGGSTTALHLQCITDIHLRSQLFNEIEANSDIRYVYLLAAVGLLILVMACINYTNLATARSALRAREVGMRKVLGAHRGQLIRQFWSEAFLMAVLASVLAMSVVWLLIPLINNLTGKVLSFQLDDTVLHVWLAGFTFGVGILAGSYPALVLSRFRPVAVMKGALSPSGRNLGFRKGLVVVQFATSVVLIMGTFVIFGQLDYVQTTKLGFDREQVLDIPVQDSEVKKHYQVMQQTLLATPEVVAVGTGEAYPGGSMPSGDLRWEGAGDGETVPVYGTWVDDAFIETLGIKMAAGRNFSRIIATDRNGVVINEAAVRAIGWASPEEAIGKKVMSSIDSQADVRVIGVVKNFHFKSLHHRIEPLILYAQFEEPNNLLVRIRPDDISGSVAAIKKVWKEVAVSQPFIYSFLDEDFGRLYIAEERWGRVMGYAAFIAILIACLGLFGLTAFTTEQRTKEIGIRKVLGASVPRLIALLSREFIMLVLVALIVAAPVAYVAMQRWLENFAYRMKLNLGIFLMSGVLILVIALITVSYQAIRTALVDPVESLRYE